jgi:hypothetical protein
VVVGVETVGVASVGVAPVPLFDFLSPFFVFAFTTTAAGGNNFIAGMASCWN